MFPRTKNRKAISTVLTTLIILVASVVLGTGVVLYGTSLFQTGAQSQALQAQGVKVWVDSKYSSGYAWGAAEIRNTGDKLLSVDTISVRGTSVPFTNWYADTDQSRVTTTNFQQPLNYTGIDQTTFVMQNYTGVQSLPAGCSGKLCINLIGTSSTNQILQLSKQNGPISLKPGDKTIVYFEVPKNVLSTVDSGASSSVAIYAGQVGAPQTVTIGSQ